MSLEDEIAINQFGQGVHSDVHLLNHFSQLDPDTKRKRVLDLVSLVSQFKPIDSDLEPARTKSALIATTDIPCFIVYTSRLKKGFRIGLAEGELEQSYTFLLDVFKKGYQRRFALEKENPTNWRYWDLSNRKIAQGILTRHNELAEEIYSNPSFRSEFVCIAKLWYERRISIQALSQEPPPEPQTHFDFLTYDEIVTEWIHVFDGKRVRSLDALRHSVEKALSSRYGIESEQVRRLILSVIERHLQETYNRGFKLRIGLFRQQLWSPFAKPIHSP